MYLCKKSRICAGGLNKKSLEKQESVKSLQRLVGSLAVHPETLFNACIRFRLPAGDH